MASSCVNALSSSNSNLRVLLVDDHRHNRKAGGALLSGLGIDPVVACDGAEALRLVKERDFDIVLMDINMPIMDGLAATEEIRRFERANPSRSNVPVIAYSSAELSTAILRFVGLNGVLRKPADALAMSECLQRWCGAKFSVRRGLSVSGYAA
jgi:CheY-like chemotaxis protein